MNPSSSDKAGLPTSLFELRRDMMPRLKMRKSEKKKLRRWEVGKVRRSEDRKQRSEDRGQMSEGRKRTEGGKLGR
jgi:hypothetical protein